MKNTRHSEPAQVDSSINKALASYTANLVAGAEDYGA